MLVFRQNSNSFTSGSKMPQKLSIDQPSQGSLCLLGFPFDEFVAAWRDDHIRGVSSIDLGLG